MSRILIVCDSLGCNNGAHVATRRMIAALRGRGVAIDLLLGCRTDDAEGLEGVRQYELPKPQRGLRWFVQGVYRRFRLGPTPRWVLDPWGWARRLMRTYDTVLVVGENSRFRCLVTGVKGPRKVVFIHTDYVNWKDSCGWAIEDSRYDRRIYRGFDVIAVVGQANADRFVSYYPEFKDKVRAFHNLFDCPPVRTGDVGRLIGSRVELVTVSRLEFGPQKVTERIVRVAGELKRRGCDFEWRIYGRGSAEAEAALRDLAKREDVADRLIFAGFVKDVRAVLAQADLHVLLSAYEGEPNVIVEALSLGVPCVSTDVGAVREMLDDGRLGLIVSQEEKEIADAIESLMKDPQKISALKRNLAGYRYDNDKVLEEYRQILGLTYETRSVN